MIDIPFAYNPSGPGKLFLPGAIWQSSSEKILITFDDAPNPATTPQLLKQLNKLNIRAVFFCIGRNAGNAPELMKEIVAEEHLIANHSYSHGNMRNLNTQEQANEILRTEETIFKITGEKTTYFRPPYGKFNRALLRTVKNIDYKMVLWSLLTYDYKNDKDIFNRSLKHLKKNSLIVMHDHPKCSETVHAGLQKLIDEVYRNNFSIGVPGECLK